MTRSISPQEALQLVKENQVLILDVRTPIENAHSRIKNSLLIPLDQLDSRVHEIPRDKPVLVYCRSGSRSLFASQILERHGFREVLNLRDGIQDCPFECLDA